MKPILSILPEAQRSLWLQLSDIPRDFVLYGGTAIALQLGHRESVDFAFFSPLPLNRNELIQKFSFLKNAEIVQPETNTLICFLTFSAGIVKFQFLGGLNNRLGRVGKIESCSDNSLQVASLKDLFACKLHVIQARAEKKDYLDIAVLLDSGLGLAEGLGCARAVFGKNFDPATSLRALCSYEEGDLPQLDKSIRNKLTKATIGVDNIPDIPRLSATIL